MTNSAAVADRVAVLETRLKLALLEREIGRVAAEIGLRPEAVLDAAARAENFFELTDTGVQPVYGTSLKSWLHGLRGSVPYLFRSEAEMPNEAMEERNPWKKETWNRTRQGAIFEADPERAKRLWMQAGSPPNSPPFSIAGLVARR
jgi:hypothetical protein